MSDRRLVPAENDRQPRQPRNLQGLLAYSMQARGGGSPASQQPVPPLSEENRQWLGEALSSMAVNVVDEMSKAIEILKNQQNNQKACEQALDVISDFVDNVDISNDFHKIGGFDVIPLCLNSNSAVVRSKAANLLAELTQNNPYCQEKAAAFIPCLLESVRCDSNQEVRVKSLYALSCCLRDYPPSLDPFIQYDGLSALLCALQSSSEKLRTKSSFLLSSLCSQNSRVRDQVHSMGMVEQLIALLQAEGQPHEHLLSALLSLVREHKGSQEDCRRPHYRLRETLDARQTEAIADDNLEQVDYCRELRSVVFGGESSDVQDR